MKEHEKLNVKIVWFETNDVITNSTSDAADDFGGWNSGWFAQDND